MMTILRRWKERRENSQYKNSPYSEGFPGGSVVKNPPANAGDTGLISGSGRSPGKRIGNPLQYSCLGNPTDREEPGGL